MNGMYALILIVILWIVGLAGIAVMKKIEPDNRIYCVWVLFVEVVFTLFVVFYEYL